MKLKPDLLGIMPRFVEVTHPCFSRRFYRSTILVWFCRSLVAWKALSHVELLRVQPRKYINPMKSPDFVDIVQADYFL